MNEWECGLCPYKVSDPDPAKVPALRDYHNRTKHGSTKVIPASGPAPKSGRGDGLLDAVGDFIGDVIGSVIKNIID